MEKALIKNCPECGKEQTYKNKYVHQRAIENNSQCLSCGAREGYFSNVDHCGDRTDCYVYCYYDPNTNLPFYVGKGVDDRYLSHLSETKETTNNPHKFNKIQKLLRDGTPPIIKILVSGLTAKEAYEIEAAEIQFLGRSDFDCGGILTNICTDVRPPDRTGTHFTEEHRRNHSNALKERYKTHKHWTIGAKRPKQSRLMKISYASGEHPLAKMNFAGAGNPRAILHEFISPSGEKFVVNGEFKKFCKEQGISTATINKAYKTGKWPTYGKSVGWRYSRVDKP